MEEEKTVEFRTSGGRTRPNLLKAAYRNTGLYSSMERQLDGKYCEHASIMPAKRALKSAA